MDILIIANDPPYGTERLYNALRLAAALLKNESNHVRVFLMGDAVSGAKAGQKTPEGYYNIERMLRRVLTRGEVLLCGTCLDARALGTEELMPDTRRSTMDEWPRRRLRPTACSCSKGASLPSPGVDPGLRPGVVPDRLGHGNDGRRPRRSTICRKPTLGDAAYRCDVSRHRAGDVPGVDVDGACRPSDRLSCGHAAGCSRWGASHAGDTRAVTPAAFRRYVSGRHLPGVCAVLPLRRR